MLNAIIDALATSLSKCSGRSVHGKLCNFGKALINVTVKIFVRVGIASVLLLVSNSIFSA